MMAAEGPELRSDSLEPVAVAPEASSDQHLTSSASYGADEPVERPTDLRLSRLHLRMGALELARAELEAQAGAGQLDTDALLDLAEVRWRTGDLSGAGVAANAYLAADRDDVLALVIAAEASAAAGHPGEARQLVSRVLGREVADLDAVFAGMPRSWMWPLEPTVEPTSVADLFPGAERPMAGPLKPESDGRPLPVSHRPPPPTPTAGGLVAVVDGSAAPVAVEPIPAGAEASAEAAAPHLQAARSALAAGDATAAADRLAELLRVRPDLSNAVLEALDRTALRPDAGGASDEPTDAEPGPDGEP